MAGCTHSADSARRPDPALLFPRLRFAPRVGLRDAALRTALGAVRLRVAG